MIGSAASVLGGTVDGALATPDTSIAPLDPNRRDTEILT